MEELLGILGFSLGASLGVSATRALGDGLRPLVRGVLKVGIRAWDVTANASAAVRGEAAAPADAAASTPASRTRSGRRRAGPQKIMIARS
jgi:hypothetical protein